MKDNWLWDMKMTEAAARKALKDPDGQSFLRIAALLLARKNNAREVFGNYLDPAVFCRNWLKIKRKMRQDKWNEPRIIFWQAIYEKLSEKLRARGISVKQKAPVTRQAACEAVGKRLADIRHEEGLSQKELARKMGVSQQLVSRIEKGSENTALGTLAKIAQALNRKTQIDFV